MRCLTHFTMGYRALAALGTSDKAKPLWRRLLAYEVVMASDQDAKRYGEYRTVQACI
jgi:hypothetical protein